MANYNWSDFSDVDIHVVLDFDEFKGDSELISDYFFKVGENFKHAHNIMFLQYNMEFFIQDSNENYVKDEGVYSILYDRWLQEPKHLKPNFNEVKIEKYVNHFLLNIKNNLSDYQNGQLTKKEFLDKTSELTDSLRKFRKSGLDSKGEFSDKNIAYKYLRRLGVLDKIKTFKAKVFDKDVSFTKNNVPPEPKKKDDKDGYTDNISYVIHGVTYSSLRDAQKRTGEKKSTIAYRVHSENPKYNDYRMVNN
jgi:hypothetical protein